MTGFIIKFIIRLIVYKIITDMIYRYYERRFREMAEEQYA